MLALKQFLEKRKNSDLKPSQVVYKLLNPYYEEPDKQYNIAGNNNG